MLTTDRKMFIASADGREICLNPAMGNRHGLVAGATGTGKTVTLSNLAESFSALGVPVFLTDIKGDLSGLSQKGEPSGGIAERISALNLKAEGYENRPYPACFWDVFGEKGHPLRATVSSLGPLLFSRLLDLNDVQGGVMHLIFKLADDRGLLLLDLKDLRSLITYVGENRQEFSVKYGNISQASLGAIQRGLLRLEEEGAEHFFGEPALELRDILLTNSDGRGLLHILAADALVRTPKLYAAVLMWLLSELFEELPEVGDLDKPRLVLMFDEAHLLFSDAPQVLVDKIEQVARLIRSKGVGVYFITQSPSDIPDSVLSQLGNRIQHALRAFTPKDQKAVRTAAQTFRPNPGFKTEEAITTLGIGEALVSFLDDKGAPGITERALILPPESRVGSISPEERRQVMLSSPLAGRYDKPIDRESAYELLSKHFAERQAETEAAEKEKELARQRKEEEAEARRQMKEQQKQDRGEQRAAKKNSDILGSAVESFAKQASRTIGREIGTKVIRGILGGLFGGRKK